MPNEYRIIAGILADAEKQLQNIAITINDGKIVSIQPFTALNTPQLNDIDAREYLVTPGFIDIHIHGGAGRSLMDGTDSAIHEVAAHLGKHGITSFLSTTVTAPWEETRACLQAASRMYHSKDNGKEGAQCIGSHLEGPFINPKKKGAQPEQHVRLPNVDELVEACGIDFPVVKVVTLAPEMPGGLELTRFLSSKGIIPSIGHTNATYAEIVDAIEAGAKHVTHCYNAMRPLDSREPGVVGAAMAHPELLAELIWDNIHVHPASCQSLIGAKSTKGVILISDGIPGAGMGDGYIFSLGSHPIQITNGAARLPDGTLAGSVLTLDKAFENSSHYSFSQRAAMTSRNAAVSLKWGDQKGLIQEGFDADLVLLASSGEVVRTIVGGRTVWDAQA